MFYLIEHDKMLIYMSFEYFLSVFKKKQIILFNKSNVVILLFTSKHYLLLVAMTSINRCYHYERSLDIREAAHS